jgi:hypothetical protein
MLYLSISFPHLIWIPALLCTSIILVKCTCGVWYVYKLYMEAHRLYSPAVRENCNKTHILVDGLGCWRAKAECLGKLGNG